MADNPITEMILEQYRSLLPVYEAMAEDIPSKLSQFFSKSGLIVAGLEHRVKTEASLRGKLTLKSGKYSSIYDITDIVGLRVITFYAEDIDKVASVIERLYDIDWENSVDKRRIHDTDSFGYLSLHYICRIKEKDCKAKEAKDIRFEIQIRSVLQHAWANMNHDTGYKSGVEVPSIYQRQMSRLAGMLELIDDEFSRIRREIADYRRNVQNLVASGNLEEVALDGDSFRSFLEIGPFDMLNKRIASINQAEIQETDLSVFLQVFKGLRFSTLGDIGKLIKEYADAAYQIACFQMGLTDLDIMASSVGPQNLCTAYILKQGGGVPGLKYMLDILNGESASNDAMAHFLVEQTKDLPFMNQ